MATCATVGQAVGTAASIAVREGALPRGITTHHIDELQQTLMDDDCFLPWHRRKVAALAQSAALTASAGSPEPLRNGLDRPIAGEDNGWTAPLGSWAEYRFDAPKKVTGLRFTFDSDLNRPEKNTPANIPLDMPAVAPPATLVRTFRALALDATGVWREIARVDGNHQRLVRLPVDVTTSAIRFVPDATWGASEAHVFAWDVQGPNGEG